MPIRPETLERQMAPRVIPLRTDDEAIEADARLWNQRQEEMRAADHPLTLAESEPETLPALLIRKGSMEPPRPVLKTSRLRLVARRIYRWLTGPACY